MARLARHFLPIRPLQRRSQLHVITPQLHPSMSDLKTLFLIRHAESLENERIGCLQRSISNVGRMSLPRLSDLRRSVELINVPAQVDSDVSAVGWDQINQVGDQLRANDFLMNNNVQLVAHSPLLRARQTSEGMLGCVTGNSTSEQKLSPPVQRVEELTCLLEKTPSEWIPGNFGGFAKRIVEFEQWVCDQPEDSIAIVGHSQFFKAMLEMSYKFDNCDVWEIKLDCTKVPGRNDAEQEEKKDDTAVVEKKDAAEADCSAQGDEVPLPRGWKGLKKLYKYDRTEKSEEGTSSE